MVSLALELITYKREVISGKVSAMCCKRAFRFVSSSRKNTTSSITSPVVEVLTIMVRKNPS
ncbi:MAG: hypothetical protein BWZ11_01762 [Bacteroidetes bacterium ADurb.BinA395]|nr:MAG: hypothetical protein BWZ11_01762 [Bacteroidetes bacterium ADurb.BinA395]